MKIHVDSTIGSRGIDRVVTALKKYVPENVEITDRDNAEVIVHHVNGRLQHLKRSIKRDNKPYVIIQYSLASSMNPDAEDWIEVWKNAVMVWSYYDLPLKDQFNFYRSPLGVEDVFKKHDVEKKYLICVHGTYLTESVKECIIAAGDSKVAYLNNDRVPKNVDSFTDISDEELAKLYSQCHYVSGLRRKEGFEFPAAEGILCGARPILFDREHYRQWYDGIADFIPEDSREVVIESLKEVFKKRNPVREDEIQIARERFRWEKVLGGFYKQLW